MPDTDLGLRDATHRVAEDAGNADDRVPRQAGVLRGSEPLEHHGVGVVQVGPRKAEGCEYLSNLIGTHADPGGGILQGNRRAAFEELPAEHRLDVALVNRGGQTLRIALAPVESPAYEPQPHQICVVEQTVGVRVQQPARHQPREFVWRESHEVREFVRVHRLAHCASVKRGQTKQIIGRIAPQRRNRLAISASIGMTSSGVEPAVTDAGCGCHGTR